jgi:hypothetical protein
MQVILLNATDATNARARALESGRASDCISYIQRQLGISGGDTYRLKREMEAVYLNTYARSKAWLQHDAHLSGMFFSVPIDKSGSCNFDPALMAN